MDLMTLDTAVYIVKEFILMDLKGYLDIDSKNIPTSYWYLIPDIFSSKQLARLLADPTICLSDVFNQVKRQLPFIKTLSLELVPFKTTEQSAYDFETLNRTISKNKTLIHMELKTTASMVSTYLERNQQTCMPI